MRFEAIGKLTEAAEIYKAILQEDETNVVRKTVMTPVLLLWTTLHGL